MEEAKRKNTNHIESLEKEKCDKNELTPTSSNDDMRKSSLEGMAALSLPRYYYPASKISGGPSTPLEEVLSPKDIMITKRRKELFGDCALIEIIHLHDCLRGALKSLQEDVNSLTLQIVQNSEKKIRDAEVATGTARIETPSPSTSPSTHISSSEESESDNLKKEESGLSDWIELERSVAGRFKVIWSVFQAHSSAEDEFIWPALRSKMQPSNSQQQKELSTSQKSNDSVISSNIGKNPATNSVAAGVGTSTSCGCGTISSGLVQEEYEEDHADEERMFSEMDELLKKLRKLLSLRFSSRSHATGNNDVTRNCDHGGNKESYDNEEASAVARKIRDSTRILADHLMRHLEKEETQCMPLVVKHLSKSEIHDLVGNIMGKRSADTIEKIMTMAVQSLSENERQEMIQYMKQSMQNTFFDRWLNASGWGQTKNSEKITGYTKSQLALSAGQDKKPPASVSSDSLSQDNKRNGDEESIQNNAKKIRTGDSMSDDQSASGENLIVKSPCVIKTETTISNPTMENQSPIQITTQAELEKLIRAIATNPALDDKQKNATIQGLRDSVWKSNEREKQRRKEPSSPPVVAVNAPLQPTTIPLLPLGSEGAQRGNESQQRTRASLPPSAYYKKTGDSKVEVVWKNDGLPSNRARLDSTSATSGDAIPLFTASELAPTFHDGAAGGVLGCPHYVRACKLRHPKSGRLYTCRLCCDQARELPAIRGGGQEDEKLDRYAVTEVMCMTCNAVQPAEDRCIHPECESYGKPFAKYFCRICHLYDGSSRPIFHCPYCNTCRLGRGLGIDFRHCMSCNACVSLDDKEHHCIPQKLQGSCPICHDTLFQSTEPLRGLKCGHVMHMTCFTEYRRTSYTCPLCMRSMEDMKDHFALLDAAIRMQPMPMNFLYTMSNIYCQDCGKTGQVQYHFVGQKCPHCSSFNTRELGRVHNQPPTTAYWT